MGPAARVAEACRGSWRSRPRGPRSGRSERVGKKVPGFLGRPPADRVVPVRGAAYRERLATLGLGLEDRLTDKVGPLSGGQRQALTLLMATLKEPDVLLLDEHTAALDPKTAAKVLELTERLVEENGLTTLMVTHNMADAIRMGNRLVMMSEGRIIYDVRGQEKASLHRSDLMAKFEEAAGMEFANDRMLLG